VRARRSRRYTDVFWLLISFDDEIRNHVREALGEAMKLGHLLRLFQCIDDERALLAHHYGSLDALRDWFIAGSPEPLAAADAATHAALRSAEEAK
jgi:hypothetical protein